MHQGIQWRCYPFCFILVLFLAGMQGYSLLPNLRTLLQITAGLLITLLLISMLFSKRLRRVTTGFILAALFMCLGGLAEGISHPSQNPRHYNHVNELSSAIGEVQSIATTGSCNLRILLQLETGKNGDNFQPIKGELLIYLMDSQAVVMPGTKMIFSWRVDPIKSPSNPGAFDMKAFYAKKGIYHLAYLRPGEFITYQPAQEKFFTIAHRLRNRALQSLTRHIKDPVPASLTASLTLGYRENLEDEIQRDFAKAGVIHVLAVSGLHVGILCSMIYFLFGFPDRGGWKRKIPVFVIYLLLTAGYAVLTGLSPSVIRATAMLWCFLLAYLIRRRNQAINSMAFCAYCFLLLDPEMLHSLSFQFSFLAVAGILMFFTPLRRQLSFKSKVENYIWASLCLSLTAQIWLLPLMAGYFHQISLISPFSSIPAIPLAYGIVLSGLLTIGLECIYPGLGWLSAQFAALLAHLLQSMTTWMADLSFSCIQHLHMSSPEVTVSFISLVFVMAWLYFKKKILWLASILFISSCIYIRSADQYSLRSVREGKILADREGPFILTNNRGDFLTIPFREGHSPYGMNEYISSVRPRSIRPSTFISELNNADSVQSRLPIIKIGDKSIAVITQGFNKNWKLTSPIHVELLLLSGRGFIDDSLLEQLSFDVLLLHDSLDYSTEGHYRKKAQELGYACYSLREEGAYTFKIPPH